jgi:hypothetical protein
MGHFMMHSQHGGGAQHGGGGWYGHGSQSPFFVPVPMAMFGVLIAFMFGMTLGMMKGSKRQVEGASHDHKGWMGHGGHGEWPGGHGHGKPWRKGGKSHHHHHGAGTPACCCAEPPSESAPQPQSED